MHGSPAFSSSSAKPLPLNALLERNRGRSETKIAAFLACLFEYCFRSSDGGQRRFLYAA